MKTVSTSVSTGDTVIINGKTATIGRQRRIDNKLQIEVHFKINETSGYTIFYTTRKLNQEITNSETKH